MNYILILVIGAYGVLFCHELGHFFAARWYGMKVLVIAAGIGPRVFSRADRWGTQWEVRLFPVGAWLKLDEGPRRGRSNTKEYFHRAIVYVAGPMANILLALTLYVLAPYSGSAGGQNYSAIGPDGLPLYLVAAFSLGVGLFNLIPVPPLDGGHMLLLAMEARQGKPLSQHQQNRFRTFGTYGIALATIASVTVLLLKIMNR